MWPQLALGLAVLAEQALPEIPFEKYKLDNGLTVILHHDARLPLVAVSVWYDVGAIHEREGRSGFAHLFEHMMFQGSAHVGEDRHFAYLEQAGATGVNGTTSYDRTNYFETVPSNQLDLALWLEADRMGFLLPALTQASLDGQIEVVKNERRQRVETAPYGVAEERLIQHLYPKPHPYHGNVIGSMDDLGAASLDDVREFFRTYYTPANATLTVAGDFDRETIRARIDKYFASLKGPLKPLPVKVDPPRISGEKLLELTDPVANLPKIKVVWMGPSAYAADTAELDVLSHVISGTKSSRLDKRVVYDAQLAQSVTAYFEERKSGSSFVIDLVVRPDKTLAEARAAIDEVLADLRKRPPTEAELKRAINAFEAQLFRGLERLGGFSGRAEVLQRYENQFGDPGRLGWDIARYRAVSVESAKRAVDTHLGADRVIVLVTPGGAR